MQKKPLRSDLWQARLALVTVLTLQWLVQSELHLAGRRIWILIVLELVLLAGLTVSSEWHVRRAQTVGALHLLFSARAARNLRIAAMGLLGCMLLINLVGLARLIAGLLTSTGTHAQELLGNALNLFVTNVIVSALWYWELDRGGPYRRCTAQPLPADFLFPQMTLDESGQQRVGAQHWRPGFIDYLYLAFTNATAFSPTDTLPLSRRAKLMMLLQAGASLMTIAIVAARAVNILG